MDASDYNVKVTVRNGRLLARIRAAGHPSVAAFCKAHGLTYTSVANIVSLYETGMNSKEEWRKIVITVSDILQCMPQDIIPEQHWRNALAKRSFELEMTSEQAELLVSSPGQPDDNLIRRELSGVLDKLMQNNLHPRHERVLRLRFGIGCEEHTLDEIGQMMGVQRERIRQMEAKAIRKLRRPSNASKLKPYLNDPAITK